MLVALGLDPGAEPDGAQQVDAGAFQYPGPDARRDVLLRPRLDDDRLDAVLREEMGEQQAGRPAPMMATSVRMGLFIDDNRPGPRRRIPRAVAEVTAAPRAAAG